MNKSEFSGNEFFSLEKSALVLYVEDEYHGGLNSFIESNYPQIVDIFQTRNIDFCYLPYLLKNTDKDMIPGYIRLCLNNDVTNDSVETIYSKVKGLLVQPFLGIGLVWIDMNQRSAVSAIGCQLIEEKPLIDQFDLFASVISELRGLRN